MSKLQYTHKEELHNLHDPQQLVPIFYNLTTPRSVVDVGCGLGTFLHVFNHEYNISNYLGIDGKWTDIRQVCKYIDSGKFLIKDLRESIHLDRKFDLVISLEVAEHIEGDFADNFVQSLVQLGDTVIFSAAIPFQLGDHHFNEQWPSYWQEKFAKHGYHFYDAIRPAIWDNENIFWWYKQNTFLVLKEGNSLENKYIKAENIQRIVHPDLLKERSSELEKIKAGERGISFYLLLFAKFIKNKLTFSPK